MIADPYLAYALLVQEMSAVRKQTARGTSAAEIASSIPKPMNGDDAIKSADKTRDPEKCR